MKAQADIISSVIIIIIAISLVSTVYMWGMPLIKKRQDATLSSRVRASFESTNFNSIQKKIEYIANNGGEDTFYLDVNGIWTVYSCDSVDGGDCSCDPSAQGLESCATENNSIQFSFFSTVSSIADDVGWVSISTTDPKEVGVSGEDSSLVWARSDSIGEGYKITYKVWFRELVQNPTTSYKIDIIPPSSTPPGIKASTDKSIKISYGGTRTLSNGKKLIITEVKLFII